MNDTNAGYAALLLRVSTGALFLAHAYLKAVTFGFVGAGKYFVSLGLPDWAIYPIIALEIVGGVALIIGAYVRWVSLAFCLELLGTIVFAHAANGWLATAKGGGWEFPALWAAAMVALALLGDGAMSVTKSSGRN